MSILIFSFHSYLNLTFPFCLFNFLFPQNTIVMHNTCEDSLLATPLILDLVILCELCERITVSLDSHSLIFALNFF